MTSITWRPNEPFSMYCGFLGIKTYRIECDNFAVIRQAADLEQFYISGQMNAREVEGALRPNGSIMTKRRLHLAYVAYSQKRVGYYRCSEYELKCNGAHITQHIIRKY